VINFRISKLPVLILGLGLVAGPSLNGHAQNSVAGPQPQEAPPRSNPTPDLPQAQPEPQSVTVEQQLQLTQDQKEKIAAIVDDEDKQLAAVRDDTTLTLEKQQKATEIKQTSVAKMKAVFTPEQLQRLDTIVRERQRNPPQTQKFPQP